MTNIRAGCACVFSQIPGHYQHKPSLTEYAYYIIMRMHIEALMARGFGVID
jgi:hypothetical protein